MELGQLTRLDGALVSPDERRLAAGPQTQQTELTVALARAACSGSRRGACSDAGRIHDDLPGAVTPLVDLRRGSEALLSSHRVDSVEATSVDDAAWLRGLASLAIPGAGVSSVATAVSCLRSLATLDLSHNKLADVASLGALSSLPHLSELNIEGNKLQSLRGFWHSANNDAGQATFRSLRHLNVGYNNLSSLEGLAAPRTASPNGLPLLAHLNAEGNLLTLLGPLSRCVSLVELYLGNNCIATLREVDCLAVFINCPSLYFSDDVN